MNSARLPILINAYVVKNIILLKQLIIQIDVPLVLLIVHLVQILPFAYHAKIILPHNRLLQILINAFLVSKILIATFVKCVFIIVLNAFL